MEESRRNFLRLTGMVGLGIAGSSILNVFANNGFNFSDITYEHSQEIFPNPERGFYPQLSARSEGEGISVDRLTSFRAEHMTLILRIYYLEKFKDKVLSEAQLALIRNDMQILRDAGMKCILRFAYTNDMEVSDAPLAIVEQHLDQLKAVFVASKDVIAFVQAGFIGAWGEWHASSNGLATTENQRKVLYKLLSVLPSEIMVQVRTPGQKQRIFQTTESVQPDKSYTDDRRRVGHHNDCFMTNPTDYGTYSADNIQTEKQYISDEGLFVPTGGETCPPVPKENIPTCAIATSTMRYLRWTYLHLNYYRPTVNAWKDAGCFDELQRDLGYRLSLKEASLPDQVGINREFNVKISIQNTGYAPLYHYKITSLVLKNSSSGQLHEIVLPVDLRECKPLGELRFNNHVNPSGIPAGSYELYLKIADQDETLRNRSEYAIRLANKEVWDPINGMNSLKHQLQIS